MTQGAGRQPTGNFDKVAIDPKAQAAVGALFEKERRRKARYRRLRIFAVILLLMALPGLSGLYCRHIIGTNFETIIVRTYPHFSETMVRSAVITDKWHLKAFGPFLKKINSKEEFEFRRAVIELGLEATGETERDTEKIRDLRDVVAAGLVKSPELCKKGIAFAVYELPPAKGK